MHSLDEAIARIAAQLPFIPTRILRRARILALLNEHTSSAFSFTQRLDDLGRLIGGSAWPLTPKHRVLVANTGAMLNAIALMSEQHDSLWASQPGVAYVVPDE